MAIKEILSFCVADEKEPQWVNITISGHMKNKVSSMQNKKERRKEECRIYC